MHHRNVPGNTKSLRDKQSLLEAPDPSGAATSWIEAVAKARYVLNRYSASLAPNDAHHRDLVAAVLADLTRLSEEDAQTPCSLDE